MKSPAPKNDKIVDEMGSGITGRIVACFLLVLTSVAFAMGGQDSGYVLAVLLDSEGNVWAGSESGGLLCNTRDHGWRIDEAFSEAGGTNVFALCEDSNKRIWAGTLDHGVCVWDGVRWTRFSIEEGLQGSHVYALAADRKDGVWIATDAGLCRYSDSHDNLMVFTRACGLPSLEISSLAVSENGDVYVGTSCLGLFRASCRSGWRKWEGPLSRARRVNSIATFGSVVAVASNEGVEVSKDSGRTWELRERCPGEPKPIAVGVSRRGVVVGFEEHGVKLLSFSEVGNAKQIEEIPAGARVTDICVDESDGSFVVGTYGKGAMMVGRKKNAVALHASHKIRRFALPKGRTIFAQNKTNGEQNLLRCYYMKDDWESKGDWCGRYGLRLALLCAQHAPYGDEIIGADPRYRIKGRIGENKKRGDVLRRWVHWKTTDKIDTLYNPLIGHRRQSEWDDHSEAYARSFQGPNLIIDIVVPDGWQEAAFYFFNKDGESGDNFRRDYLISVCEGKSKSNAPLAVSRVTRFRNGVYKRFALRGPGSFTFEINRGNSFSTILSGVFLRKMAESPEHQSSPRLSTCAHFGGLVYREPSFDVNSPDSFQREMGSCCSGADYDIALNRYLNGYREARDSGESPVLRLFRWHLRIWNSEDRNRFDQAMLAAWTCRQMKNPKCRFAKYFPDSPNVLPREPKLEDYSVKSPLYWHSDPSLINCETARKTDGDFYLRIVNLHGKGDYLNE